MSPVWREELRQRLQRIQRNGGPPQPGVEIVIPAEQMRVSGHDVFLAHAGQLNDAPFCGAAPGTLEIGFTGSWEKHPQLRFIYRPQPPHGFFPARSRALQSGEHANAANVITGVDFGSLP